MIYNMKATHVAFTLQAAKFDDPVIANTKIRWILWRTLKNITSFSMNNYATTERRKDWDLKEYTLP